MCKGQYKIRLAAKKPILHNLNNIFSKVKIKCLTSQHPEIKFKEFEPRFKSAKPRFKLSAGVNLETFNTILSGTNHI